MCWLCLVVGCERVVCVCVCGECVDGLWVWFEWCENVLVILGVIVWCLSMYCSGV